MGSGLLMETLQGDSGVLHTFARVSRGPGGTRVVDSCGAGACDVDVIKLRMKALDVGAVSAEIIAPSYTPMARELAKEYGIRLKSSTTRSRMRLSPRRSGRTG